MITDMIVSFFVWAFAGAVASLLPFFIARYRGLPNLALWALICGTVASGLIWAVGILTVLGFTIAAFVCQRDMPSFRRAPGGYSAPAASPTPPPPTSPGPGPASAGGLTIYCIAGPLRGQTYPLSRSGLTIGRDVDCTIRFPANAGGVSRHHCAVRWQQGVPVLVDLGSSYGTFLGDGRKLPPNYPTGIAPGTRFYLARPDNLFQVVTL